MTDKITPDRRSWNMSQIRGSETKIENMVRHYLFHAGFRYRKNVKSLPGKPDIVLPKYHTVIFVHGCFWHNHEGCKRATIPKTRTDFWMDKFQKNKEKDKANEEALKNLGWNIIVLWECQIEEHFEDIMGIVVERLREIDYNI